MKQIGDGARTASRTLDLERIICISIVVSSAGKKTCNLLLGPLPVHLQLCSRHVGGKANRGAERNYIKPVFSHDCSSDSH